MHYSTLRAANAERQREWTGGREPGPLFRAVELAGEIGEIQEIIFNGNPIVPASGVENIFAWFDGLADELADGIICLDLLALSLGLKGIAYDTLPKPKPTESLLPSQLALALGAVVGAGACNLVKKIERERQGWVGSRSSPERVAVSLLSAAMLIDRIASVYGIDLKEAVPAKFNKTSEQHGLLTRLVFDPPEEAS